MVAGAFASARCLRAKLTAKTDREAIGSPLEYLALGEVPISPLLLASRVGFEPTTQGLKVPCSAAELPARTGPYHVQIGHRGLGDSGESRIDRGRSSSHSAGVRRLMLPILVATLCAGC